MKRLSIGLLSVLLSGCVTDVNNDPRSGGLIGGMHGLAAGDYNARQDHLEGRRNDGVRELRALQDEGGELEVRRQMKAEDVAWQQRQLAGLKAKNRALAQRIGQLHRSRNTSEQQTLQVERQYAQLTQNIDQFERQLDQGRLTVQQAELRRLALEQQYATLSSNL